MKKGYDSLNDAFNTDGSVEVDEAPRVDEVKKDYDYTRGNLYSLIEKGQEAINGIMEVAGETASPRAYEVAGQLIKKLKKLKRIIQKNKTQSRITHYS